MLTFENHLYRVFSSRSVTKVSGYSQLPLSSFILRLVEIKTIHLLWFLSVLQTKPEHHHLPFPEFPIEDWVWAVFLTNH